MKKLIGNFFLAKILKEKSVNHWRYETNITSEPFGQSKTTLGNIFKFLTIRGVPYRQKVTQSIKNFKQKS